MINATVSKYSDLLKGLYHSCHFSNVDGNDFMNSKPVAGPEDLDATYFALTVSLTQAPTENQRRLLEEELDGIFTKGLQIRIVPVTKDRYSFFFVRKNAEMTAYFMRLNLETVADRATQMQGALGAQPPNRKPMPHPSRVAEIAHG